MRTYIIPLAVLVVVACAGVIFFFLPASRPAAPSGDVSLDFGAKAATGSTAALWQKEAPGVDSKEYRNEAFKFSLHYPKNLTFTEYKEQGDAMTIVFESEDAQWGFQIYITPYSGTTITKERFALDSPSGVFKEPLEVMIDGQRAVLFFGKNSIMGETREVWIIHGGYLYEVTTYSDLDAWLGSIMQTWKFEQ